MVNYDEVFDLYSYVVGYLFVGDYMVVFSCLVDVDELELDENVEDGFIFQVVIEISIIVGNEIVLVF